jgi:adenosylhomocysteine nucleosidase
MMLRHLVQQWIRQSASKQVFESLSEAVRETRQTSSPAASAREGEDLPCDVVVAFALGVEAGGTVDLLEGSRYSRCASFVEYAGSWEGHRVAIVETGVGREAAAAATADMIAVHRPRWVISAGFAGAMTAELKRGHILMADEVTDPQQHHLAIGLQIDRTTIESSRGLHVGRLLTVDRLIRTAAEKQELAAQHAAVACDMETFAVAEVCQQHKVRFLAVRIVTDGIDDELPQEIERLLDQKSLAAKLGAATGAVFKRPSSIKDMWKLKEDALLASDRLAKFLAGIVRQLEADDRARQAD